MHNGRVRPGHGVMGPAVATIRSGAVLLSTHETRALKASYRSVDGPPPQWFMPGTAKKRTKSEALPLFNLLTSFTHEIVSLTEKTGSLTPCVISSLPPCFLKAERSVELASMKSHADFE